LQNRFQKHCEKLQLTARQFPDWWNNLKMLYPTALSCAKLKKEKLYQEMNRKVAKGDNASGKAERTN